MGEFDEDKEEEEEEEDMDTSGEVSNFQDLYERPC